MRDYHLAEFRFIIAGSNVHQLLQAIVVFTVLETISELYRIISTVLSGISSILSPVYMILTDSERF